MIPLLWSWHDEWLILPAVRPWVSRLAACCAWLAAGSAALAAAEILLALGNAAPSLLCGLLSHAATELLFILSVPLILWCHIVLAAQRGLTATRYLLLFCLLFTALHAVCCVFTAVTGELLLALQGLLPLLLPLLVHTAMAANWHHIAALPRFMRFRIIAAPVCIPLICVTDIPGSILLAVLFKALLCWAVWAPLRQLAAFAPRVVGLPPKAEEEATD